MKQISRKVAKKLGFSEYFTGIPCKRGHIAARWVHSYSCLECHRLFSEEHRKTKKSQATRNNIYEERKLNTPEKLLVWSARKHAREANVPFTITHEDVKIIWPKDGKCPVLGMELKSGDGACLPSSPSLDRFDPKKGYIKGNITIISMRANRIKSSETDPSIVHKVANWMEQNIKGND